MDHMDMDGDMPMPSNTTEAFCSKGMSMAMYMNGMQITKPDPMNMCIIYVFQSLVLDTQAKYIAAVIFTVFWAFATECVRSAAVVLRQSWMKTPAGNTLIFTVQMVMAYLIMLVVMIYDVGMFLAVVIGLAMGHFFLEMVKQTQRLRQKQKKQKQRTQGHQGYHTNLDNSNDNDNVDDDALLFADGGTPCCPPVEVELE